MSNEVFVSLLAVAVSTVLYVFGFSYLQGYYRFFGAELNEFQIGPYSILSHSLPALITTLKQEFIDILLWTIMITLAFHVLTILVRSSFITENRKPLFVLIGLIAFSVEVNEHTLSIGMNAARGDVSKLPIATTLKGDSAVEKAIRKGAQTGDLKFLASTATTTILVYAPRAGTDDEMVEVQVFRVPHGANVTFIKRMFRGE